MNTIVKTQPGTQAAAGKDILDDLTKGLLLDSNALTGFDNASLCKANVRDQKASRITKQYFCTNRPFAWPRGGNKVTMLPSGKAALQAMHDAMIKAKHFVWIADWQMAFDVELTQRGHPDHPGRLWVIIEKLISRKENPIHVRIILYRSVKDTIPGTYDGLVAKRIEELNKRGYGGSVKVFLQAPTSDQFDPFDYSHHQKFVVVDGQVAFVGGIDLTYGRWETPEFDVVADPGRMLINEMYNPCVDRLRGVSSQELKDIAKWKLAAPYGEVLIDEGCQPRMPWQDVHVQLEGRAAMDVHVNFTRRWNMGTASDIIAPINQRWLEKIGAWPSLQAAMQARPGNAEVQVVRSVSSPHLKCEGDRPADLALYEHEMQKAEASERLKASHGYHQDNVRDAVINCIRSAEKYIYIETQFFISKFGTFKSANGKTFDSSTMGNEGKGILNGVADALVQRIAVSIEAGEPFHVYLVIPVHPEGLLDSGATWKQQMLALLTIKHGSQSMVHRIQQALRSNCRDPQEWVQYLTVLNMRNYGATVQYARDPKTFDEDFSREIGRYVVTEQIYIHSKLMIVDDAVAIIGSANTNDRSLTGNGDTEIATVIVDGDGVENSDLGSGSNPVQTRRFARELRKSLWEKHFGFMVDPAGYFNATQRAVRDDKTVPAPLLATDNRRRMSEKGFDARLEEIGVTQTWLEILQKPCAPPVVAAIQKIARHNANAYEKVFLHTPRNGFSTFMKGLEFHQLPYPATGVPAEKSASVPVVPTRGAYESPASRNRRIAKVRGRHARGMPPPLHPNFMTTSLLSHQRVALNETDPSRRHQLYADGKQHDLTKSLKYLQEQLIGFFVAAPLDWGMGTPVEGALDKESAIGVDLAGLHSSNHEQSLS